MQIGSLELGTPVVLAPMAGVTDRPFRRLVRSFGIDWVVSEMIASKAMVRAARKTLRMSTVCHDEHPMAVQLAGCDPTVMADAARLNEDRGAAMIDINMGCPVKKVVNDQAGAALMRDEGLAGRILAAVVKAVDVPVTLKMRLGWNDQERNARRIARMAEDSGIAAITVHGRTRAQLYSGSADWQAIGEVKDAVSIPVVGNGDVVTIEDAETLLAQSGADGVMIGRGTYGRPWFPQRVRHFLATGERLDEPSLAVRLETVMRHYDDILTHYGAESGVRIARKHVGWYSKGLPGAAEFRGTVNRTADPEAVRSMILSLFRGPLSGEAA